MTEDMRDKKTVTVAAKVSEQTALDLLREAAKQDMSNSEWLERLICRELYGCRGMQSKEHDVNNG